MSAEADVQLTNFPTLFSLSGKTALVTGGSRGLGLHAASGLLQAGCSQVFISSRKAGACQAACDALNALPTKAPGAVAIPIAADSSTGAQIDTLLAEVKKHTSKLDILFANAGATWGESFETHPEAAFQKVMDLNVKGVFLLVQRFLPLLEAAAAPGSAARVLVTASVAGLVPGSLGKNATFGYSASKAAAIHLARNLAVELGPRHILTNAIAPGFFPSKMANGLMELAGGAENLAQANPNKKLGEATDFAGTVVFLCSRAANHINGDTIVLDGGKRWQTARL